MWIVGRLGGQVLAGAHLARKPVPTFRDAFLHCRATASLLELMVGVIAQGRGAAGRGWLNGLAARLRGPRRGQGLGQALNNAAFFALGVLVTLLALYPYLHLAVLQTLKDATEPLGHTVAFAALTVVGAITWGLTWTLIAGLSGLAVWLELAQFLSPGREPDLVQVAGSLAGILLGLILARFWRRERQST